MSNTDQEDFMGGGDSLKFESIGDMHEGTLLSISSQSDTDPQGKVKTWDDGSPKKVFKWVLETESGPATMWVRGNMVKVLREACAKAGAKKQADLIGSKVQVKHHALGEAKKGFHPAKLFQAKVTLAPADERGADQEFDPFAE